MRATVSALSALLSGSIAVLLSYADVFNLFYEQINEEISKHIVSCSIELFCE